MTDDLDKWKPRQRVRMRTRDTLTIPGSLKHPQTYQKFAKLHFFYSLVGLLLGLGCVLGGMVLCWHGVPGAASWSMKLIGAESKISDATPGVILIVVGLFVILVTRFSIKTQRV